ncbi:acyltransferase family protein [Clostridium manihotivorum]|uniref:Acyltransferase 3 domain-containing protein n=1 Tax=Clostridium manihotivorum TaxID=2320868 RepID=A0A3R5QXS1_9CLOT|nr:acyltransferase family protein [Clostridium manihotivorum]QAA34727.1 hypothetical protein C1I91_25545 [Clostridium manihotivorum]
MYQTINKKYNDKKIYTSSYSRVTWIDIAKGYGILFVILGHIGASFLKSEIYTFHIPLFFFLSGCVFSANKYNLKNFIKRKIKTIIIPYIMLGIPMIIFTFFKMYNENNRNINDYGLLVVKFLMQERLWTLWFMACLFWLNILFYLLVKRLNNNYKKVGAATITLMILGVLYYKFIGVPLIWNIDVCLTAIPFFYAGYLFKNEHYIQNIVLKKERKLICFIIFLFINLFCGMLAHKIDGGGLEMFRSSYGFAPLTYLSAFGGIVCIVIISSSFDIKFIKYIGANSLVYFAWHQTIIMPIVNEVYKTLNVFQSENLSFSLKILKTSLSLFIILIVLTLADYIIRNTKLKFMLGMK